MNKEISGQITVSEEQIKKIGDVKDIDNFKKVIEDNISGDITSFVEALLIGAILLEVSDIHVEPEEEDITIRIRMDGVLHEIIKIEQEVYKRLLSRIKILSSIKLNVVDTSQDGRFTINIGKKEIETRISVLPSEYGETIVARVLDPKNLIEIEELGIRKDIKQVFEKEIKQPNGMIIVTGPTGSGKTTTLYAILKKLKNSEIKIVTIEDPIEYHLPGISQSQVNEKKGYTFASGLQAIVRQDPDVILIGEIRNLETAQIALQAALTGHLVLTTLHTNDAAGTVVRLQALGEKLTNIAPALNLAIAQRLARKVCEKCKEMKAPTSEESKKIEKEFESLPKTVKLPPITKIPTAKGCPACNNSGYSGRIGIYEFFQVDDEMENFIIASPSIADLNKKAKERGMASVRQDGFIKVIEGVTTIKEIERVTGE
ncbi:MAG: type II/IV secretion system protein [Parcubacteria group bacterium]|nr:type II/IV secretion system protein [Parcubacteria group bacterium]